MQKRLALLLIIIALAVGCSVLNETANVVDIDATQTRSVAPYSLTATALEQLGISATPDPFELTATQLVFDGTTYSAEATSGTYQARATSERLTREAYEASIITMTKAAETAIANGCEPVEHNYQSYIFYYRIRGQVEVRELERSISHSVVFDCPDPDNSPYEPIDIYVDVVVPDDADEVEIFDILEQVLIRLLEYPPTETTLGTGNLQLSVKRNYDPYDRYIMNFTYSDMLSALEDGLEGEDLLEVLGGVEAME